MGHSSVHFVSLGCPKNLVDSQVMLGALKSECFQLTDKPEDAETIIVNTCGFIESAKQESIDTLLEMANFKKQGACKNLIMSGCLAQRYSDSLAEEMPEVDFFVGTGEYHRIAHLLKEKVLGKMRDKIFVDVPQYIHTEDTPRMNTGLSHSAFLKVSEGCKRRCSFCIIPQLRGGQVRSRSVASLRKEAESLVAKGVRELNLVAQDLTHYGVEGNYKESLEHLLQALVTIDDLKWIRLHYAYPDNFTDAVIDLLASEDKLIPYIDMPIQHGDDHVLRLMNRRIKSKDIYTLVEKMRRNIPGLVFRTNLIVGHPGETEKAFRTLKQMVLDLEFDRLGVFKYSLEEGTASHLLAQKIGAVEEPTIQLRYREILEIQQKISYEKNKKLVGKRLEVLVEGVSQESDLLLQGRWYGQAQEIDGVVLINEGTGGVGEFVEVQISQALPYDLVGAIKRKGE